MIAKPSLLFVTALLLVGCSDPTPVLEEPPQNQLASATSRSSASSESEDNSGSDCLGNQTIRELHDEYAANPLRARQTYVGKWICVEGRITEFDQLPERFLRVRLATEDNVEFALVEFDPGWDRSKLRNTRKSYGEDERETWENWKEWVMSANVGDVVEAECKITFIDPTERSHSTPSEAPVLEECTKK